MSQDSQDVGKLVMRVALGLLVLLHGVAKITGGIGGIGQMLQGAGLPPVLAYGVYVGEVLAPLMLIAGFHARIGAALIALNMLFAIFLAHRGDLAAFNGQGGWALELQGMFLFTAIGLAFIGPGRFSANKK
ncbi:DoxX family protein [Arenimonas sp. MALMAid1274]|uniref:DoxX family protein n=1 Tax=Arenimonas sp. MALMAid1274 TaxID=3411630 RepID=UPI003BA01AC1